MFDAMLRNAAIADKLGPNSYLGVLECFVATYAPSEYPELVTTPCAQRLPHGNAYHAPQTLAVFGFSIDPACQQTSWADQLTAEQAMGLLQLALQHGNFTDISTVCRCAPAVKQLGPQCVLQLAVPLLQTTTGEGWEASQPREQAAKSVLSLPGAAALSVQDCNQLAAVAIQRGRLRAQLLPDGNTFAAVTAARCGTVLWLQHSHECVGASQG
jgi:hypothetical protein